MCGNEHGVKVLTSNIVSNDTPSITNQEPASINCRNNLTSQTTESGHFENDAHSHTPMHYEQNVAKLFVYEKSLAWRIIEISELSTKSALRFENFPVCMHIFHPILYLFNVSPSQYEKFNCWKLKISVLISVTPKRAMQKRLRYIPNMKQLLREFVSRSFGGNLNLIKIHTTNWRWNSNNCFA